VLAVLALASGCPSGRDAARAPEARLPLSLVDRLEEAAVLESAANAPGGAPEGDRTLLYRTGFEAEDAPESALPPGLSAALARLGEADAGGGEWALALRPLAAAPGDDEPAFALAIPAAGFHAVGVRALVRPPGRFWVVEDPDEPPPGPPRLVEAPFGRLYRTGRANEVFPGETAGPRGFRTATARFRTRAGTRSLWLVFRGPAGSAGALDELEVWEPRGASGFRDFATSRFQATVPATRALKKLVRTEDGQREAIFAPPPTALAWDLRLPRDPAELTLGLGLLAETGAAPGGPPDLALRVTATLPGEAPQVLLELAPDAAPRAVSRPAEVRVDLARFAGRDLRLAIETSARTPAGLARPAPALLLEPRIAPPPGAPTRPNLLLVTIDSLRADHVGCYGYAKPTTPCLDALARAGARVETVIVQRATTAISLPSILTSTYPRTSGVRQPGAFLPRWTPTIADVLSREGYRTGAFMCDLGYDANLGKGFETLCAPGPEDEYLDDDFLLAGLDAFLARGRDRPFFAWIHLWGPHAPWGGRPDLLPLFDAPGGSTLDAVPLALCEEIAGGRVRLTARDRARAVALYDVALRRTDERLGRLFARLGELGLADGTVLAVSADHGNELFEHAPFVFHHTDYDASLRVPLIVRDPRRPGLAGQVRAGPVEAIDIAPTLLSLLGVRAPEAFEGADLAPYLEGRATAPPREFAHSEVLELQAIRDARWKLIVNRTPGAAPPEIGYLPPAEDQLFDLALDPREERNLAAAQPEIAARLRAALAAWLGEGEAERPLALSQEVEGVLRRAGYLGSR
jgi:arylsulfatase A-like enzyme